MVKRAKAREKAKKKKEEERIRDQELLPDKITRLRVQLQMVLSICPLANFI